MQMDRRPHGSHLHDHTGLQTALSAPLESKEVSMGRRLYARPLLELAVAQTVLRPHASPIIKHREAQMDLRPLANRLLELRQL